MGAPVLVKSKLDIKDTEKPSCTPNQPTTPESHFCLEIL
jgi:hypothetical protein